VKRDPFRPAGLLTGYRRCGSRHRGARLLLFQAGALVKSPGLSIGPVTALVIASVVLIGAVGYAAWFAERDVVHAVINISAILPKGRRPGFAAKSPTRNSW
jgi:hypothetical protein